jgi:hypothetical protein
MSLGSLHLPVIAASFLVAFQPFPLVYLITLLYIWDLLPTPELHFGPASGCISSSGNLGIGETGKVTSGISSEFELAFDSWQHARAPLAHCAQILYPVVNQ